MTSVPHDLAARLIEAARETVHRGLNQGRTGNASVRSPTGCLITPSGLALDRVAAEDLVGIDLDGAVLEGAGMGVASSEWRLHTEIYRARPEIGAVIHCHSISATGLSALRIAIPAFHYMVPALGGADIRCADYAIYGSAALAAETVRALDGRTACLLANHGAVACGTEPEDALEAAVMVEMLAAQYCAARLVGDPVLLSAREVDELLAGFSAYRATVASLWPASGRRESV
jgi:L-fuculose-phosphate aldolase